MSLPFLTGNLGSWLILTQAWYLTEAMEAMEAMEAIASIAPGLCLGVLSKVPIEIYKFFIEVPFAKEKSPCPFKYEVSGLLTSIATCRWSAGIVGGLISMLISMQ